MPRRNSSSSSKTKTTTTTTVRKSPRLANQKTPDIEKPKKRSNRVSSASSISSSKNLHFSSPITSVVDVERDDLKGTHDGCPGDFVKNQVRSINGLKMHSKSANGLGKSRGKVNGVEGLRSLRRSPRFSSVVTVDGFSGKNSREGESGVGNSEVRRLLNDFSDEFERKQKGDLEKRRTRSSGKMGFVKDEGKADVGAVPNEELTKGMEGERGCGFTVPSTGKRASRMNLTTPLRSIENIALTTKTRERCSTNVSKELVRSMAELTKPVYGSRTGKTDSGVGFQGPRRSSRLLNKENVPSFVSDDEESPAMTPMVGKDRKRTLDRVIDENGGKSRNNQSDKNCGFQEWTKDQEAALKRAYFAEKPSSHFWKKVSKQVPGKSAQECFDKIQSDLVTPPQPRPRSRAKNRNLSPLSNISLSGSKLLEPTVVDIKWPKNKRQKNLRAQKTLRHLVQKNCTMDKGYKADLFSVLEPVASTSTVFSQFQTVSTPDCVSKKPGSIQEFLEKSPIPQQRSLSRFRNTSQVALVSPPVLKQVKNKALHDKYIDRLHCREAKRMAGGTKSITGDEYTKEDHAKKRNALNAAKNALVFDAKDMIQQFQHLQANVNSNFDDSHNDDTDDPERETDDEGEI